MPILPLRRKRPILRWTRWFFLVLSVVSLGYVGFSLLDAELFQARENWRLDRAVEVLPAAAAPSQGLPASSSSREGVLRTKVVPGSTLGRIEISRIGVAAIIAEGTGGRALRRGVGHISGTALPGEPGNVAIAGHRDTFFRALRDIRQGDEVLLTTVQGSYRYRVDSMRVVAAEDVEVLDDSGESILTLVTCYPFYFVGPAPKRFVVRAHRT